MTQSPAPCQIPNSQSKISMLTKLTIRNFKQFDAVEIELGQVVVFVGPNNSGKTTALQALALWDYGVRRWNEKREGKSTPGRRPGVTINRRDLLALPIPEAKLLWRDLHVRNVDRGSGKQKTNNINIEIIVEGESSGRTWTCGMEFDYANAESFYCRPLRIADGNDPPRMPVPEQVSGLRLTYLPPMSGLAAQEIRLDPGTINVRLGEGRTAEVLRNLCYQVTQVPNDGEQRWERICARLDSLFGVALDKPKFVQERGEIDVTYRNSRKVRMDLSSAGRGLQQTLLLLTHLELNPAGVLMLDEPDAHLEVLRQRQTYSLLAEAVQEHSSQVLVASHSEVILDEAAKRDVVVAFLGKPHRIDDRGRQQLAKSLKQIEHVHYLQAEQTGWVLYLEGATDLAILAAFAARLGHPAQEVLERPFVKYVGNQPQQARDHFWGLQAAKPDLVGYLLCDRLDRALKPSPELREYMWTRREIENYVCQPETLIEFAKYQGRETWGELFAAGESKRRADLMRSSIEEQTAPAAIRDPHDRFWVDVKASDEFLDRVFADYLRRLELPVSLLKKSDYHRLASFVPPELIDSEVVQVLDGILEVSRKARPVTSP